MVKASSPPAFSHSLLCFSLSFRFCPSVSSDSLNLTYTESRNCSLSARRSVWTERAQRRVSGLNAEVLPYQVCIHSHNEPRSLSCFSVRRVQTRPLFSTSSDASLFFFTPVLLEQRLESSHHAGLGRVSSDTPCERGENHTVSSDLLSGSVRARLGYNCSV